MIVSSRAMDCAPLDPDGVTGVSGADLRRIEPVQRALLSPLAHGSVDGWRRAVNRELMTAFGSDAAMFQLETEGAALQYSEQFEMHYLDRYTSEVMPQLSRERRLYGRMVKIKAGNRSLLWGRDLEWLYRSPYFNEMILPMRAFDPLWAGAAGGGRYPAVIHTYHDRRRSRRFFGPEDVALMHLVQPALEAGVRTLGHMESSRGALLASLEAGSAGALVYDPAGRLLHRSAAAGGMAVDAADERVLVEAGREMALGLASGDAAERVAGGNVVRRIRTRSGRLELSAVQVAEGTYTLTPVVLVTVARQDAAPLPDREAVRTRFGLTRRQAEVALLLARRKTNPEMAEMLCISEHTVRSHVEAVMAKLQVRDRRKVATTLRSGGA